ncbi:hypothetical protein FRX31_006638 [Thalictrum thalictroides]|uniref:Uncharacterized protein n=1 Tax=Thalictrum thalictroides TaxID=46969 RepID=A0A7J6X4M4_THATH|nr:hypothetical protein FRX31_006638 [Thalictrum thalictroides]
MNTPSPLNHPEYLISGGETDLLQLLHAAMALLHMKLSLPFHAAFHTHCRDPFWGEAGINMLCAIDSNEN